MSPPTLGTPIFGGFKGQTVSSFEGTVSGKQAWPRTYPQSSAQGKHETHLGGRERGECASSQKLDEKLTSPPSLAWLPPQSTAQPGPALQSAVPLTPKAMSAMLPAPGSTRNILRRVRPECLQRTQ